MRRGLPKAPSSTETCGVDRYVVGVAFDDDAVIGVAEEAQVLRDTIQLGECGRQDVCRPRGEHLPALELESAADRGRIDLRLFAFALASPATATSLRDNVSTMPRVTRSNFSVLGSETENMMTKNAINSVIASA